MNPEEYVIVKKSEVVKMLGFYMKIKACHYSSEDGLTSYNINYVDAKINCLKWILETSKQLQPLLEETFEEAKRQHDWAGGHIYGKGKYGQEEEDLTDWKYPNFEDFIKQKEI